MKLSAVALFTVFAAAARAAQLPTVYAAECTPAQLEIGNNAGEAAFKKACPAATEPSGLDITDLGSFNVSALMQQDPCEDATCTAYLKSQAAAAPDCELNGLNLKKASDGVLKICVGIADGVLSEVDIKALFTEATGNSTSSGSESSTTTGSEGVELGSLSAGWPETNGPAPSTTVPSPFHSGSSIASIAGAAAAATATLASFLLL